MRREVLLKGKLLSRYVFAALLIIVGVGLMQAGIGNEFLGFSSVGHWLVFVGFVMVAVNVVQSMSKRRRVVDERMRAVALQAGRVTFIFVIFAAFVIMVIDGLKPIELSYSMFMSHFIAWMMVVYFVSYKLLLRFGRVEY